MSDARSFLRHPACLMIWLPLLVGLQGVPHTGALRTLFMLIGIAHLIWLRRSNQVSLPKFYGGIEQTVFWLLTAWLVLQSAWIAPETLSTVKALASDWGKLILMAALGIGLVKIVPDRKWVALALFSGAFLHVLSTLGAQIISLTQVGGLAYQQSLLCEYPVASSFTTAAFAWLMADSVSRLWHGRPVFPWPVGITATLALMALISEALLKAKSGQVMTIVLIAVVGLLLLARPGLGRRWSRGMAAAGILAVGLIIAVGGNRWSGIGESLHSAWQEPIPLQALVTDNTPLPVGTSHSFYIRAIRGKVGVEGIMQHPWGLGFGSDVFQRYVAERYDIPDAVSSSNSGLIDFALANGVVGLCLLLVLAGVLIRRGLSTFIAGRPEGLVLALLVLNQIGGYALDGTLGGSRFNGFALVAGALWALSVMNAATQRSRAMDNSEQK